VAEWTDEMTDDERRQAVVDLLGLLAYTELTAFERLAEDARWAPSIADKVALAEMAAAEFAHFRTLRERLEKMGHDAEVAMRPFVVPLDAFHDSTAPSDWLESVVKAYVGDGFAADFYREVAEYVDPEARALVLDVLEDTGHAQFAVDHVRAAIAADAAVAGRLALWARRLVGEALAVKEGAVAAPQVGDPGPPLRVGDERGVPSGDPQVGEPDHPRGAVEGLGLHLLVLQVLQQGLHVQVSAGLWRVGHSRLHVAPLAHEPFFSLKAAGLSPAQRRIKRGLDLAVALPAIVLLTPILFLVALAVKLQDGGPVLFRQARVGRNGKPFTLLKFRTMAVGAEARLDELLAQNERNGPLFKMDDDPRVTRVGRFLRASSLDELPQFFNVVGGSMSMVGPRPALPLEVATFDDDLLGRHSLPPGITGLWQIEARDNPSFYAYRHLDLFYVENWSCALDLMVLAGTAPNLLARSVRTVLGRSTTTEPALQVVGERARI